MAKRGTDGHKHHTYQRASSPRRAAVRKTGLTIGARKQQRSAFQRSAHRHK